MDINKICMGCMKDKGDKTVCPSCGYDERETVSPLVLTPGTRLNSDTYLIGRVLGKPGGFGITYLGFDLKLQTMVAIKEFLPKDLAGRSTDRSSVIPHHTDDKEIFEFGLQQFLREARTLAKFNHPNIVRVRTFFEENGTAYLVMDYYDGVSLAEYIKSNGGKVAEKLAVDIMMPILDGLREVHDKGFLHRDIKPQNIYLTEGGIPILLDFGSARFAMGERSRSLSVVLTPGFAPFEQYQRKGKQGPWTDIYSCAATLYFMITGEELPEASDRVTDDELIEPQKIVKNISSHVNNMLIQALSMEVNERPQSIKEFQNMLMEEKLSQAESLLPGPEFEQEVAPSLENVETLQEFKDLLLKKKNKMPPHSDLTSFPIDLKDSVLVKKCLKCNSFMLNVRTIRGLLSGKYKWKCQKCKKKITTYNSLRHFGLWFLGIIFLALAFVEGSSTVLILYTLLSGVLLIALSIQRAFIALKYKTVILNLENKTVLNKEAEISFKCINCDSELKLKNQKLYNTFLGDVPFRVKCKKCGTTNGIKNKGENYVASKIGFFDV